MRGEDKGNILCVCAVALCVMLTLGLCLMLSGQGFIGAVMFEGVKSESVFFVCSGPYKDVALARSSAELVKSRGGAGYMLGAGEYELVYAAYSSKKDAESVSSGIAGTYLKQIDIKKSKLKWASKDEKTATLAALKYYDVAFSTLSECANGLNKNEIALEDVKVKISTLRQQIEDIKTVYSQNTPDDITSKTADIKLAHMTALALVDNLTLNGGDALALSSLRYAVVQLVLSRQALMERI